MGCIIEYSPVQAPYILKNLLTFFDAYDIINLMTGYVILKDIS